MEFLDARGISNLLWGFARLEHHPGLAFLDGLLGRMLPMLMTQDPRRRWVRAWAAGVCDTPASPQVTALRYAYTA